MSSLVANSVVACDKHCLNGATLDVSFETRHSDNAKSKTIEVAGLAANTTEDSVWNYFENKRRSGGGAVETVDLRSDTGVAFVTFKDDNGKLFILIYLLFVSYNNRFKLKQITHCTNNFLSINYGAVKEPAKKVNGV